MQAFGFNEALWLMATGTATVCRHRSNRHVWPSQLEDNETFRDRTGNQAQADR